MCVAVDLPVFPGKHVLLVAPHPDDETMGAHFLLEKEVVSASFTVMLVTDGDACGDCAAGSNLASVRFEESSRAMSRYPGVRIVRLSLSDGDLQSSRNQLMNQLRLYEETEHPDIIIGPAPNDRTPDHAVVGECLELIFDHNRLFYFRSTWASFNLKDSNFVYEGDPLCKIIAIDNYISQSKLPLSEAVVYSALEAEIKWGNPRLSEGIISHSRWLIQRLNRPNNMLNPMRVAISKQAFRMFHKFFEFIF